MMMMNSQQQQQQPQQKQLVVAVEGTAALGPAWPVLRTEYVEKIVRAFYGFSGAGQKNTGSPGDMALVVFTSHGSNGGTLVERSAWTSSLDLFFRWLAAIHFEGGGFGDAAVAEGLAEALLMMCPGPNVPPVPQGIERQKHCILVAASNPHRLPTAVPSPPVTSIVQSQGNATEIQSDHWILADADTIAQAFAPCSVSLSVVAPRQLPMFRNIFSQAKRTSRAPDTTSEPPKASSQHLVLLSEAFLEARMALHRTVVPNALTASVPKIEQHQSASINGSSVTNQMPIAGARPASGPAAGIGALTGRPVSTLPMQPVTVKTEAASQGTLNSLLHHNPASSNMSLPMQQLPAAGGLASPETIQSSMTSIASPDTQQDFKGLGNMQSSQPLRPIGSNVLSSSSLMAHSPSQSRHTVGSPSLPPASPLSGLQPNSGTGVVTSNVMSNAQSGLGASGQQGGVGMGSNNSSVGMNSGQAGVGVGSLHGNYNTGTANLVNTQMPASVQSNASLVNTGAAVTGQGIGTVPGVSGQGGLAPPNQMGTGGLGPVMAGQGTSGVNTGTAPMMPPAGVPQSPGQPQPLSSTTSTAVSSHHPPAAAAQPQAQKYTKLWEGILAGQRKGNIVPIPICKLEGYRQTSSSETLASDWPPTMQIMRLIPQEYMNQKDYHRKAELLVFRPLTQHDFLVQLAEKKLCAVIQLPSQTLLLASTDKPGRMIGMLFPGDMVQIKPQVSSQQPQTSTGSTAPQAQSHPGGQSGLVIQNHPVGQNALSQNHPVGQSTLSQGHPVAQSGLLQNHAIGQSGMSHNHSVGQGGLSQTHTVGQGGLTSSALGQNTLGQSGFVQNQLQGQLQNQMPGVNQLSSSQVPNAQARNQLMPGSAGLHGSGFLP
ncbi:hypothetical protein R1flu_006889 [Riccia fluitans]|uniref:Mediator of RNA polymerase II transcription subunit 25 n=1 Tax=Riccia fluitans TaxID=41844 RepID=A0ABD1YY56_9MARC